jgi:hypothetical protein
MRTRRAVLLMLSALLVSSLGCKGEAPTGTIKPAKVQAKVGDTVSLTLVVPSKFDGVQREMWKVEPESLGEVYFDQASANRRDATFRAKAVGTGKIVVHGFLSEPAPHRIAEVAVTVE